MVTDLRDILVVDLEYGSLYRNQGNGLLRIITEKAGLAGVLAGKGSWGGHPVDYDNDGDPTCLSRTVQQKN